MRRVATDSVIVTVLNTAAQLAGFVLFAAITSIFGANEKTDAFFLAYTVPMLFIGPVGSAIRTVLLPIFAESRARNLGLLSSLIGAALVQGLLISLVACVLLAAGTPLVLPLVSRTLAPETRHLVVMLTIFLLPLIIGQTLSAVLGSMYNVAGRFALPAIASGSRHLVALGLILLLHARLGIRILPLAFVAAAGYQLAVLAVSWRTLGVRIHWSMGAAAELRRPLRLALPLVLGSSALYLTVLVTRVVASHLEPGSVTILDYASRIISALMEVLTAGVLLVVLANWSHTLQQESVETLRARLRRTVVLVLFLVMPALTILFALRVPAVTLMLGRGQFNAQLVAATASVMAVLLVATPMDVIGRIYMRYFIAQQSTWVVAFAAGLRLLVVAALALVLIHPFHLRGLALADSLAVAAVAVFFVAMADAKGTRILAGAALPLARITVLAIVAGIVAAGMAQVMAGAGLLLLAITAASAGGLAYLLGAWLTGAAELRTVLGMFSRSVAGAG